MPIVKDGPQNKRGVDKLWRYFDMHGIRETSRAIRVQAGTIEVAMVSTGKLEEAKNAYALLKNGIAELGILLEGKKHADD